MDNKISHLNKILDSIDNLLIENKEQKLKTKLAEKIKNNIFTDEILSKVNEYDFSEVLDDEQNVVKLFDSIFPIFIKKDSVIFRLYKHKIEVDLSDEMKDRYIYMFSDGRLTSGLFQCFNISDDEYVYGVKKIIQCSELFRKQILLTLENYKNNIDKSVQKINFSKEREKKAIKNYDELTRYLKNINSWKEINNANTY